VKKLHRIEFRLKKNKLILIDITASLIDVRPEEIL